MNKAVIGIVSKYFKEDEERVRPSSHISKEVKQAIFDNGAIAIGILSPNDEIQRTNDNWLDYINQINKEKIIEQIKMCDGIILQGGAITEAYECFIAKYCYDNDIPCLGICAGQNSIVRALGGTTKNLEDTRKHNQVDKEYVHTIKIDKTSKFYSIVKKEKIKVNSRHKSVVDNCPNLNKVGLSHEGYAEVVENQNKRFYIGLRFHPESLYHKDKYMNNIFEFFINECLKYKRNNNITNGEKLINEIKEGVEFTEGRSELHTYKFSKYISSCTAHLIDKRLKLKRKLYK